MDDDDEEEQQLREMARWLARKDTVARLIDEVPDPAAIMVLRAWRELTFGPPPPGGPPSVTRPRSPERDARAAPSGRNRKGHAEKQIATCTGRETMEVTRGFYRAPFLRARPCHKPRTT